MSRIPLNLFRGMPTPSSLPPMICVICGYLLSLVFRQSGTLRLPDPHIFSQEGWNIQVLTVNDRGFALLKATARNRLEL